jgi:hypothetical protein
VHEVRFIMVTERRFMRLTGTTARAAPPIPSMEKTGTTFKIRSRKTQVAKCKKISPHDESLNSCKGKILRSLPKPPGAMVSEEILAEAIRRDQELESGVLESLTEEAFWDSKVAIVRLG